MKYKVFALAVLVLIIYSCAVKSTVPTVSVIQTKPEESSPAPSPTPISTTSVVTVMASELVEGKSLYENNCAQCHNLYDAKDFSAEMWKPIVLRMQKKAHLDDMQGQKIYNYLTIN